MFLLKCELPRYWKNINSDKIERFKLTLENRGPFAINDKFYHCKRKKKKENMDIQCDRRTI